MRKDHLYFHYHPHHQSCICPVRILAVVLRFVMVLVVKTGELKSVIVEQRV